MNRISSQQKVICYLQFITCNWTGDQQCTVLWPYFTTDSLNKTRKLKAHKNNRQTYATWILSLTGCCQPCMVYIPGYQPDDTPPSHWAWSSQEESQSQVNSLRWVGFWLIGVTFTFHNDVTLTLWMLQQTHIPFTSLPYMYLASLVPRMLVGYTPSYNELYMH